MKDYLKEPLTEDEKAFVYGIIRNTSLKFAREFLRIQDKEVRIDDAQDNAEELFIDTNTFDLVDRILDNKILRDISDLKPYTKYEKEKIVETLERIALNSALKSFITPLTFKEKLVVFLLYMENYQVNELSILLQVDRSTIWRWDKSIKKKFNKVKGKFNNGK